MEDQAPYTVKKQGGARPGSGRPAFLKGGKYVRIYIDTKTEKALKQIHPNRSKAIRILAGTDPLE